MPHLMILLQKPSGQAFSVRQGYYGLRINESNQLVLRDEDENEVVVGVVSVTTDDILDVTADGNANRGKALKTDAGGAVKVAEVKAPGVSIVDSVSGKKITLTSTNRLTDDRQMEILGDISGYIATMPAYANQSAANAAEDPDVVYFNQGTGKIQVTTG